MEVMGERSRVVERAVLADLEQRVSGQMTAELMREPARREFRSAHFDGSYPNTAIVVSYLDLNTAVWRSRASQCGMRDTASAERCWIRRALGNSSGSRS
jgi:uncharacterized protein YceH (UPF0502 family)